jgi:uncharacterized protein
MLSIQQTDEGVAFRIRVLPRSSRCELLGIQNDALKMKITAPPVEGRANDECIRFLAGLLNVKKGQVAIRGGLTSRNKTVTISGLTRSDILAIIPET